MSANDEKVESELKGNTLRVYWALLRSQNRVVGVREVQKSLGFSSPALSSYHLKKLQNLGLVREELGEYHLIREVKVGVQVGGFLLTGSTVMEHFVESTPTVTIISIQVGDQGEWDICLESNGAVKEKTYYFRLVQSDGTTLNSYEEYPTLTTAS